MKNKYILAFILLLSLFLGIIGIDWGLPDIWTSDELMGSVLAMGKNPNDAIYKELKGKVPELYRIGDCVAPRKTQYAIWDGHMIGRKI